MARARQRQQARRGAAVCLLATAVVLAGLAFVQGAKLPPSHPTESAAPGPTSEYPATEESLAHAAWPEDGSGAWRYADQTGEVLGERGEVAKLRVAVEEEIDLSPDEVAAEVEAILADPRGWTAGGKHRFQLVGADAESDFTVFFATPGTSTELCAASGFHTDGFTSCHLSGELIINVARWLAGVPGYGAPLAEYRAYAINHELGHELGFVHEACPGAGQPAPVMQPQTLGLQECTANGWPYLRDSRYRGPKVP